MCLPCRNISRRIFGAETPKIEIAVQNMKKNNKKQNKNKVDIFRIFPLINTSYHTKQEKNWRGCTYGAS